MLEILILTMWVLVQYNIPNATLAGWPLQVLCRRKLQKHILPSSIWTDCNLQLLTTEQIVPLLSRLSADPNTSSLVAKRSSSPRTGASLLSTAKNNTWCARSCISAELSSFGPLLSSAPLSPTRAVPFKEQVRNWR
jgi:hypothetical protein